MYTKPFARLDVSLPRLRATEQERGRCPLSARPWRPSTRPRPSTWRKPTSSRAPKAIEALQDAVCSAKDCWKCHRIGKAAEKAKCSKSQAKAGLAFYTIERGEKGGEEAAAKGGGAE